MNATEHQQQVRLSKVALNLLVILAATILFNVFPQRVGFWRSAIDLSSFTPVLAPEFTSYLPWLNVWWGVAFSVNVSLLILRRRIPLSGWVEVGISVYGGVLLTALAMGAPFQMVAWASALVRLILALAALLTFFKASRLARGLLAKSRAVSST